MVKKVAVYAVAAIFFMSVAMPLFAKNEAKGGPNPSKKAYERANERARFKRTEGAKDNEAMKAAKEAEKAKRLAEKEAKKAEKEAAKAKRLAEKEARKLKKGL